MTTMQMSALEQDQPNPPVSLLRLPRDAEASSGWICLKGSRHPSNMAPASPSRTAVLSKQCEPNSYSTGTMTPIRLPLVIRTKEDLKTLIKISRTRRPLPKSQFVLAIPNIQEAECLVAQQKLNTYSRTCGCAEGGVFALTAA